ncbi:acyltransferase [Kovacikia minuta CCNUW1]|uniref:acyltransferase n=1 Tax=Kovacikia minuta TaxID=2931930 RepID=UPI001CCBAC98|nr:acyltransferase [Kovacikia minuta]UBF25155.1 acyltransferase [Kovacikia minuta CCNUW1]
MIYDVQQPDSLLRAQRRASLITAVFGSIPLFIGRKLRRFVYRTVFADLGADVNIEPGLELIGAYGISIGNQSSISSNVALNCWVPNSKIVIHDRVRIDRGVFLNPLGGRIEIDDMTYIGPYVCVGGPGRIKIGRNCLIASHTSMYANSHNFSNLDIPISKQGLTCKGIQIEDDCWLGTGVRILDGVTIGKGSVIGAGAVVTKDIPPYSVAVGVPAKVIKNRESNQRVLIPPIN